MESDEGRGDVMFLGERLWLQRAVSPDQGASA
jgi:hypothetical protein